MIARESNSRPDGALGRVRQKPAAQPMAGSSIIWQVETLPSCAAASLAVLRSAV
eukprot:gene26566-33166_t